MSNLNANGTLANALVLGLVLGAFVPKIDPAALEFLRQQQAAEAAGQKADEARKAADRAFEKLERNFR